MFDEMYENIVRSRLFSLEPIGIGTPNVESLSGYISRLAVHHSIKTGDLIAKLITPLLNKEYLINQATKGGEGLYKSSNAINGFGTLAQDLINVIEELTAKDHLGVTTLLKWSQVFPTRGLLRSKRAWCSSCFYEDYKNNKTLYERLIWNFQVTHICEVHNQQLTEICPECSKSSPVLTRRSKPGYCFICEKFLGKELQRENELSSINESSKYVALIGQLLSENRTSEEKPSKKLVSEGVNFYISKYFNGQSSEISRALNISKSTLSGWYSGESLPQIKSLLEICIFLGLNVSDFIKKKEANIKQKNIPSKKDKDRALRKKHDHHKIKKYLNHVVQNKIPISINKVAINIGCDRKLLYHKYPIECKKIKENYLSHLGDEKKKKDKAKLDKVENAFNLLIKRNEYPSRRRMENIIGEGSLREKMLKEKWNLLKDSSGY